jgi:hypothetical protein
MRIGKWKLLLAAKPIKDQFEGIDAVEKEMQTIDPEELSRLLPVTAEWVRRWQAILEFVKKR